MRSLPTITLIQGAGAMPSAGAPVGKMRLPTDPKGTLTATFKGINANSEIRVYLPDMTEVAGVELCAADPTLTWSAYAIGSANNTVRIVIIHPAYKIKEFTFESSVGVISIPVQQERDPWYSNT